MIANQLALMRREIWEHRSIYVTPLAIAAVITLGTLATLVFVGDFAEALDAAIVGAQNVAGDTERRAILAGFFIGTSWLFVVALFILTIFYTLDCLYAERKDKSILFWRSLPITDAETVVSKLLTALVVLPLFTFVTLIATNLVNLVVTSIWVSMRGGDAGHLIWSSLPLFDTWLTALIVLLAMAIWMSPFIGWFLFVSAFTKRSPLLTAFMPLLVIPLIELIFLRSNYFFKAVFWRSGAIPLFRDMDLEHFFDEDRMRVSEEAVSLLAHLDVVQFISSPAVWTGVVVCGLFTTAAIYVRRYRDES